MCGCVCARYPIRRTGAGVSDTAKRAGWTTVWHGTQWAALPSILCHPCLAACVRTLSDTHGVYTRADPEAHKAVFYTHLSDLLGNGWFYGAAFECLANPKKRVKPTMKMGQQVYCQDRVVLQALWIGAILQQDVPHGTAVCKQRIPELEADPRSPGWPIGCQLTAPAAPLAT